MKMDELTMLDIEALVNRMLYREGSIDKRKYQATIKRIEKKMKKLSEENKK